VKRASWGTWMPFDDSDLIEVDGATQPPAREGRTLSVTFSVQPRGLGELRVSRKRTSGPEGRAHFNRLMDE